MTSGTIAALAIVVSSIAVQPSPAPPPVLAARLQASLDAARAGGAAPGMTAAVALADSSSFALATGLADRERAAPMRAGDRLLAGSVGKTFVAAVALQLVSEGKLALDDRIEKHLGREPFFDRLPNARAITVRMLLSHTSGLVRYEFDAAFIRDLTADPNRTFRPAELLAYLDGVPAPFPAGERFEYSDTNYIVLGLVVESVAGRTLREEIAARCLAPHGLTGTIPSDSRRIEGLAVGYAGKQNPFGGADAMVVGGEFVFNPQFEWAGGGYASTAEDLARWILAVSEGRAYDPALASASTEGAVDASRLLGRGASYGLGVIVREGTPLGRAVGHSGYFPGYLTEAWAFPEKKLAVAVMCNTSDGAAVGRSLFSIVTELGGVAAGVEANVAPQRR